MHDRRIHRSGAKEPPAGELLHERYEPMSERMGEDAMNNYPERLRAIKIMDEVSSDNPLGRDAAGHIEAMEAMNVRLLLALDHIEGEAMRYAEMYPIHSDMRNTFIIFGDMVTRQRAAALDNAS
jgi:hypothetical protein